MVSRVTHQKWLIIANGEPLSSAKLQALAEDKKIVALDGALNERLCQLLLPDIVLGDFDSIDAKLMASLKQHAQITFVHTPDQQSTDLEKGLRYVISHQPASITICQATGFRLDHTLHNIRLLRRFHNDCHELCIITETEKIVYLQDQSITLRAKNKEPLALLAFPQARITSQGLAYDMQDYPLRFAEQESTSNHIVKKHATIQVCGEAILIISHETKLKR